MAPATLLACVALVDCDGVILLVDLLPETLVHCRHEVFHLIAPAPVTVCNQDVLTKRFTDLIQKGGDALLAVGILSELHLSPGFSLVEIHEAPVQSSFLTDVCLEGVLVDGLAVVG